MHKILQTTRKLGASQGPCMKITDYGRNLRGVAEMKSGDSTGYFNSDMAEQLGAGSDENSALPSRFKNQS